MKEIVKNGVILWLRTIVVTLMSFFICLSMNALLRMTFAVETGYDVYGQKENASTEFLYTHYYDNGDDTKRQEYEAEGYTIRTQKKMEMTKVGRVVNLSITQLFCTILTICFVYPNLWRMGAGDTNLVRYKHKKEDVFKGLKIGIIASIPSILLYIGFVVCKFISPTLPVVIYRLLNSNNYSFIYVICREASGKTVLVGDLAAWQFVLIFLPLLIVPVTAFLGYFLGFKEISISDRLVYKENK